MKFVDLVNVSDTCKRFFLISKAHIKFTETITLSKRIIKFDDYYTEFLQNQLLDLESSLYKKLNEELSSNISYELTPFKVLCHCFFVPEEADLLKDV